MCSLVSLAVSAMLVCYALERRSHWSVLLFAAPALSGPPMASFKALGRLGWSRRSGQWSPLRAGWPYGNLGLHSIKISSQQHVGGGDAHGWARRQDARRRADGAVWTSGRAGERFRRHGRLSKIDNFRWAQTFVAPDTLDNYVVMTSFYDSSGGGSRFQKQGLILASALECLDRRLEATASQRDTARRYKPPKIRYLKTWPSRTVNARFPAVNRQLRLRRDSFAQQDPRPGTRARPGRRGRAHLKLAAVDACWRLRPSAPQRYRERLGGLGGRHVIGNLGRLNR